MLLSFALLRYFHEKNFRVYKNCIFIECRKLFSGTKTFFMREIFISRAKRNFACRKYPLPHQTPLEIFFPRTVSILFFRTC